jgi:putative redox protein
LVKIDVVYEGELRCNAKHGPSGVEVSTDAPVDNNGKGESFSPTDLVATALGSCMLTIMGIRAEQQGWDITGTQLAVKKSMVDDPVRRIGKLDVQVRVPHDLDKRARAVLEEAAHSCPVMHCLYPGIEVQVVFEWGSVPAPAVQG